MTTYRAAVWLSLDKQSEVRLTSEDESHLSDDDLKAAAQKCMDEIGLEMGSGSIVITEYTEA